MVWHAAGAQKRAVEILDNLADVRVEAGCVVGQDQLGPSLGTEDNVVHEIGEGLSHRRRVLGGREPRRAALRARKPPLVYPGFRSRTRCTLGYWWPPFGLRN